jgi:hypothetical protein
MFKVIIGAIGGALLAIIVGVSTNILTPITNKLLNNKGVITETNNSKSSSKKIQKNSESIIVPSSKSIIKPLSEKNNNSISTPKKVKKIYSSKKYKKVYLIISGNASLVTIKKSLSSLPYSGGTISSDGNRQTIFLPKNQPLSIKLSGNGVRLEIEKSIAGQINVNNSGNGSIILTR